MDGKKFLSFDQNEDGQCFRRLSSESDKLDIVP